MGQVAWQQIQLDDPIATTIRIRCNIRASSSIYWEESIHEYCHEIHREC